MVELLYIYIYSAHKNSYVISIKILLNTPLRPNRNELRCIYNFQALTLDDLVCDSFVCSKKFLGM